MPHPRSTLLIRPFLLLTLALTFSGCVSRSYKLADKNAAPAVALNLSSGSVGETGNPGSAAPAQAVVHTVVVYQGPGSWKREAYWDEYVISVTNRTEAPLVVDNATLHANSGESLAPGDKPWPLERTGKSWWNSAAGEQTGMYLKLGAGTVAGFGTLAAGVFSAGFWGPVSSGAAAAIGVGTVAVVALPVVALSSVGMNIHRKHQVEAEFNRRRLVLPLTIEPGQTVNGSFFFRITPSPRAIEFHASTAGEPRNISVSLAPLASLHMRLPVIAAQP
jgi:hypothetical protein